MNKIFLLFLIFLLFGIFTFSYAAENAANNGGQSSATPKALVVYFSCTGVTEDLAKYAASALNADLYRITPQEPYSEADLNYRDKNSRSSIEMNDPSSRPTIGGAKANIAQYDVIFLGYPIWWGQAPHIINTFLESDDFSGKIIAPFCTSGSSGVGSSDSNLHKFAPNAKWLSGAKISSNDAMKNWINNLGISLTVN